MKRTAILASMLILLLSLTLVSCDAMFATNIFAGITHPKQSAADIASKTPAELQAFIGSAAYLKQLTEDPDLKNAALGNLAAYYVGADQTAMEAPAAQTAAIVAAGISIQTVPTAAGLSGAILAYAAGGSTISASTEEDVATLVKDILPQDIADSLGGAMPASFSEMIAAFSAANTAYEALGEGVGITGYAAGTDLTSSDMSEIAVNALISGLVSAVVPLDSGGLPIADPTSAQVAEALWSAISDPTIAANTISFDSASFDALTVTDPDNDPLTNDAGPIANLLAASALGSMMGGQ